ncbi:aldo/keto reductase [Natranaerofaba carboxydovora]|uniref:aldo/keto reductase n=1 Tax=Natranaerofaba carboxydovora TaxID=2742683 RepID=UPI001F134F1D|nr:aldo/keto reductase [Natranaerofaba carboxydovora]UMZ74271.1 General stress protein 69 [Natranaerofaba carboxydovora]
MKNFLNRRNFIKLGIGTLGGLSIFGISELLKEDNGMKKGELDDKIGSKNEKDEKKIEDENKDDKDSEKNKKEQEKAKEQKVNGIPYRNLGKTGEKVSLFGLGSGAGAIALENGATREDAYDVINKSIDEGINYIDTAPSYADGLCEENIGEVMKGRREEVILATKTMSRSYDGVMQDMEGSLDRLNTDVIDIYQLHGLSNHDDVAELFVNDGAVRALEELKEQGVIRYTGVTGHNDPEVLLRAISKYDFDTLLMPLNTGDIHSKPFQQDLLDKALEKEMGIIAMKVVAYGRLLREDGVTSIEDALSYVYSFPISTAIVGVSNLTQLEENVQITRKFEKLSDEKLKELEELTGHYEYEANFFKYEW